MRALPVQTSARAPLAGFAGAAQANPNRGVVVNELKPRQVEEIYEVRVLLETGAARITPLPAPPDVIAEMELIQDRHEQAVNDGVVLSMLSNGVGCMQTFRQSSFNASALS